MYFAAKFNDSISTNCVFQSAQTRGPNPKRPLDIVTFDNSGNRTILGTVTIEEGYTTLLDLHLVVKMHVDTPSSQTKIAKIILLVRGMPIPDKELENWLASEALPALW